MLVIFVQRPHRALCKFQKLLEYNTGKMPFAAAQIGTFFLSFLSLSLSLKHTHLTGTGFRNEIAPRSGLLRVRKFPMAEIEHFMNPEEKDHPKFDIVSGDCLPLFPQDNQLGDGKIISDKTLKTAVSDGTINNQTLAYFMARTYYISSTHFSQTPTPTGTFAFLTSIGIKRLTFDFVNISRVRWHTTPPTAGMLRSISPTDGRNVWVLPIVPALI